MNKTKLGEFVEWLEIELKKAERYCDVNIGAFIPHPSQTVLVKARQLLSEEEAQIPCNNCEVLKPGGVIKIDDIETGKCSVCGKELFPRKQQKPVPAGLVEELERWFNEAERVCEYLDSERKRFHEILSRYPASPVQEESLAVDKYTVPQLIAELERRKPDCRKCAWPTCDLCLNCFWKDFGGIDKFKTK